MCLSLFLAGTDATISELVAPSTKTEPNQDSSTAAIFS